MDDVHGWIAVVMPCAAVTAPSAHQLSYAHALGVVHRDIKPENVLLSGKHAMVRDFGVAEALGQTTLGDRITGVTLGRPAYMSPAEQRVVTEVKARIAKLRGATG